MKMGFSLSLGSMALCLSLTAGAHAQEAKQKAAVRALLSDKKPGAVVVNVGDDAVNLASKLPREWMGVRCTPLPEPVRAQLGRDQGIMIGNIAEGSPAERAGLERFDIITQFNGRTIQDMDQLVEEVGSAGADRAISMSIVRGGKERSVSITLAERPKGPVTFKFDEPEADPATSGVQFYGHRMQMDPSGGGWMVQPLGQMPGLSDDVMDRIKLSLPSGQAGILHNLGGGAWTGIDPGDLKGLLDIDVHAVGDDDGQVEIRVRRKTDEGTLEVDRSADGKVRVTREAADGTRTESTYESMDDFEAKDADAFKQFGRFGSGGRAYMLQLPDPQALGSLQQDFQKRIQVQIERTRDQVEKAQQDVDKAVQKTRKQVRKVQERRADAAAGGQGGSSSESVSITRDNDKIDIRIEKDGNATSYHFDSLEELKRREPELYERFKHALSEKP